NKQWHGSPAQPLRNWMRASVIFKHLPDVEKRINVLEEELKRLTSELEKNTINNER
ncbi:MAG: UDP-3-O-(3-hydroxymyristoyl)glucosamine N-acyltransferase, partial [Chitinophagaceae bacterium]